MSHSASLKPRIPVTVVGAGIIGLQTALLLQQSGNYDVTVIAEHWPGDLAGVNYASMQAGAHWRPQGPHDAPFDTPTYHYWTSLLLQHPPSTTGLKLLPAVCYWELPNPETHNSAERLWWRHVVHDFHILPQSELPKGTVFGVKYRTFGVNPEVLMKFLLEEGKKSGVKTKKEKLTRLPNGIVVNCSGFGAGELLGDENMSPTKGQTVLVKGEAKRMLFRETREGWHDVVIVRPGAGTILGVSKSYGDWSEEEDKEITNKILERGKENCPELLGKDGQFEVLRVNVGRRPARKTGVRIEVEERKDGVVVHQYGHGGGGVQNSYGSAVLAVRLLDKTLKMPNAKL